VWSAIQGGVIVRVLLCVVLLLSSVPDAVAAKYELLFFTQDPSVCKPCIPVRAMVNQLTNEGRAITVYNYQLDPRPFDYYWPEGAQTPSFILLKDGEVFRRYIPDAKRGLVFSVDFLRGIAPPDGSKPLDAAKPSTAKDCAGNPFTKALKNILPVPPPPLDGLPADVPDRVKVKRIEQLEALVRDLRMTVNVLRSELAEVGKGRDGQPGLDGANGRDGRPGERGPAGPPGRDGVDDRPIQVRIDVVNDAGTVIETNTKTYPRGTPVVLRFHEKLLKGE